MGRRATSITRVTRDAMAGMQSEIKRFMSVAFMFVCGGALAIVRLGHSGYSVGLLVQPMPERI
jgi:hypothetical protein